MSESIVFEYVGKGRFVPAVPARNLTAADVERLADQFRGAEELERQLLGSKAYVRAKAAAKKKRPKKDSEDTAVVVVPTDES